MTVFVEHEFEKYNLAKTPMTEGERTFVNKIKETFSDSFRNIEVYIQPNINGFRPDILCIEKSNNDTPGGIWIIEVKDWNLNNFNLNENQDWFYNTGKTLHNLQSPHDQVTNYKNLINELIDEDLVPYTNNLRQHIITSNDSLKQQISNKKAANWLVKTAIYFHTNTKIDINQKYLNVFFKDFDEKELEAFFNSSKYTALSDESYQNIKQYLGVMDCEYEVDVFEPDKKQLRILSDFQNGHRRKKYIGPAGVGKTELLANLVASELNRGTNNVLVLTFNITLRPFIKDRIRNALRRPIKQGDLEIHHYHEFIKINMDKYKINLNDHDFLKAASDVLLFEKARMGIQKYSAIFIDEGQDYESEWIQIIEKYFLDDNAAYVVCGDANQNVYNRKFEDKKLPRVSILGRVNELNENHRSINKITELADEFQQTFLENKYEVPRVEIQQLSIFDFEKSQGMILLCEYENLRTVFSFLNSILKKHKIHPNDVAIVCFTREKLRDYIDIYNECCERDFSMNYRKITPQSRTVCSNQEIKNNNSSDTIEQLERELKLRFTPNFGTTKAITINSLKGLEIKNQILLLNDLQNSLKQHESIDELFYVALTRATTKQIILYNRNEIKNNRILEYIAFLESRVDGINVKKQNFC